MQRLLHAIEQYNASRRKYWDSDYNSLIQAGPATAAELSRLEAANGQPLPKPLRAFYLRLGGLSNLYNNESYCIEAPRPAELADGLERSQPYERIGSLGLIDMIVHSWANDRFEFAEGEHFSRAQLQALNGRYRCFGWYRTDTVGESAWYLYFDPHGHFGALYYDQDGFGRAYAALMAMLQASPARQSLEDVLCEGIERMRAAMIEWQDDGG